MIQLLIVEDHQKMADMMAMYLTRHHYQVLTAADGLQALDVLETRHVDIIIVDLMMPEMDGLEFIELLRQTDKATPVLIVTAKTDMDSKRKGFSLGADDYIEKPVKMEELLLRIEAMLRRARIVEARKLTVGGTTLREDSLSVSWQDTVTVLTQKEFFLLQKLLSYPGKIFTRQMLMDEIWGYEATSHPRTVDVHIKRLREKFEGNRDFTIVTVRNLGYKAEVTHED